MAGPLQLGVIHTCRQEPVQQALTEQKALSTSFSSFWKLFFTQFEYQLQEINGYMCYSIRHDKVREKNF
jgi:hypothetical protein